MQNEAARFEKGPGRGGVPWSNECRFPSRLPKTPRPRPEGWTDEGQTRHGHGAQERARRALPGASPRPVARITAAPTCCHAIGDSLPAPTADRTRCAEAAGPPELQILTENAAGPRVREEKSRRSYRGHFKPLHQTPIKTSPISRNSGSAGLR